MPAGENTFDINFMKERFRKDGKKAIHRFLFSRIIILILMLLAQLAVFYATFVWLVKVQTAVMTCLTLLSIGVIIYIVNDKSNLSFKLPWCILIAAAPAIGSMFYIYIKVDASTKKLKRSLDRAELMTERYSVTAEDVRAEVNDIPGFSEISHYLETTGHNPTYKDTDVTYYPMGELYWQALLEELEGAENFIFMEFFVIAEDSVMWQSVLDVLKRKAAAGVEVRFIYDGMCSLVLVPVGYYKELRRMGIKCKQYEPIVPVFSTAQNNRDHRKIAVIDGKAAFTGGINLSDEYVNVTHPYGRWKDTAVKLEGKAVQGFTKMFLEMWNITEKTPESPDMYMENIDFRDVSGDGYVIPYGDNMPNGIDIAESVYLDILNTAHRYVHIFTPYLILTQEMLMALTFAARRGVEVKIILPGIPDKKFVYFMARSYYPVLMEAGVKVYQYTPGFDHAKVFISDDVRATVGTINMDFRSFYHHFECAAYIFGNKCIKEIEQDFCDTIEQSQLMTVQDYRRINFIERMLGRFGRIFGCLM